jgi:prevent-host-death family protein
MKRPAIARDLVPVNEFRANMASWMHQLEESGRPVVLTQRGRAAAVLVEPAMLDEIEESRDIVRRVLRALEDVERGELHEDSDVWAEVEEVITRGEGRSRAHPVD